MSLSLEPLNMDLYPEVNKLRRLLPTSGPLMSMDNKLLLLSTITNDNIIPPELKKNLFYLYGTTNQKRLEYLGDAILEVIVIEYLFLRSDISATLPLTPLSQSIVRNSALSCLMARLTGCPQIGKQCANQFEALLGAAYIHLKNMSQPLDPIREIHIWLNTLINLDENMDYIIYLSRSSDNIQEFQRWKKNANYIMNASARRFIK